MKKVFASLLIALFTLMIIAEPRSVQLNPPQDRAEAVGDLMVFVLLVGALFFSVRWYFKVSGHTHKLNRQAWAIILFWYSVVAAFIGFAMIGITGAAFGVPMVLLWAGIALACWKWHQRLRRAEGLV